jgi:hypothetical protein
MIVGNRMNPLQCVNMFSVMSITYVNYKQSLYDQSQEAWTKMIKEFLLRAKKEKECANGMLNMRKLMKLEQEYSAILAEGEKLHPTC